jgi:hypothetical protein
MPVLTNIHAGNRTEAFCDGMLSALAEPLRQTQGLMQDAPR